MRGPASLAATPWQAPFSPYGRERSLVPEVEIDLGEKQRLMALAAGRMAGGGLKPSAGLDVSSCAPWVPLTDRCIAVLSEGSPAL